MEHGPLTVSVLTRLGMLAEAVERGQVIAWMTEGGTVHYGVARAFTRDGGGLLLGEDVRDGFVWISGGDGLMERWLPVADLVAGLAEGRVALDYTP